MRDLDLPSKPILSISQIFVEPELENKDITALKIRDIAERIVQAWKIVV
jgi:hypothetical protein